LPLPSPRHAWRPGAAGHWRNSGAKSAARGPGVAGRPPPISAAEPPQRRAALLPHAARQAGPGYRSPQLQAGHFQRGRLKRFD
nr:hypothetical protein [Tanacetum cinerariifolium]